ncbi:MAG: HDOD domain-containing protein [Betaproteobacteria bacterium]|nr:HDOD domain-containing protein [Betaproteobacteria bacterium]
MLHRLAARAMARRLHRALKREGLRRGPSVADPDGRNKGIEIPAVWPPAIAMEMTQLELARLEERAEESVRKLALPSCPGILAEISREVRAEAPNVRRIGDLVTRDVAASAGILKTVNSVAYGLRGAARSVQQAIGYLGLDRTALLLAGLLLRNAFPSADRPVLARFWQASAQLATAAGFLARALGVADRDEAYTFGLFRDAGSAVLICRYADYDSVLAACPESATVTDHEKAHFGADHAVIGAVLARDWHLPEEMSDAILWHHADFVLALDAAPIRLEAVRLIALGVLGDRVIDRYRGEHESAGVAGALKHALRLLGLAERDFADLETEALTLLAERDGRPMPTMRLRTLRGLG